MESGGPTALLPFQHMSNCPVLNHSTPQTQVATMQGLPHSGESAFACSSVVMEYNEVISLKLKHI